MIIAQLESVCEIAAAKPLWKRSFKRDGPQSPPKNIFVFAAKPLSGHLRSGSDAFRDVLTKFAKISSKMDERGPQNENTETTHLHQPNPLLPIFLNQMLVGHHYSM